MVRNVWHGTILCPCLCMQLGLHLWFIFFVIPDDVHNCDMVMMLLSVELCQSYVLGLINFVHAVLSTILKFLRVLLLSMNDGGVMLLLVLSGNLGPLFSKTWNFTLSHFLIPDTLGIEVSAVKWHLFAFPLSLGSLGICNPVFLASHLFNSSVSGIKHLFRSIVGFDTLILSQILIFFAFFIINSFIVNS